MSHTPHQSSLDLAQRVGGIAHVCHVVANRPISTSLREVVLHGDVRLAGEPGNDVMVRVRAGEHHVRRRYSVRHVDKDAHRFTLWVSVDHEGPGSAWALEVEPGTSLDVVGPRGKITLREADWHLFVGDVAALAAFYRMAEAIEAPGRALFVVEIDHDDDALTARFDEGLGVTGVFVDRRGRRRDDPAGLLSGLAALELPEGDGQAYVFGEFHVIRAVRAALGERGLSDDAVRHKAYYRLGRANADHGEPDKREA